MIITRGGYSGRGRGIRPPTSTYKVYGNPPPPRSPSPRALLTSDFLATFSKKGFPLLLGKGEEGKETKKAKKNPPPQQKCEINPDNKDISKRQ